VCFFNLLHFTFRPCKKGGGLNEKELTDTLNVQLATIVFKNLVAKGKKKKKD
jgi:hypothetical protein